jgi:septum site-determining protein MinC
MASQTAIPDQTAVFQLKGGLYTLSALQLLSVQLTHFAEQLDHKIQQAPKFFHNAPLVIDLIKIGRPGLDLNFKLLKELLVSRNLIPVGVKGGTREQHADAIAAGFAVLMDSTREKAEQTREKEQTNLPLDPLPETTRKKMGQEKHLEEKLGEVRGSNTRVITEPVRSGQQIYARGGDLLVLAPVSHGAELLADGHIHVYGPLRGRALAGVTGDTEAHILCQSLEAELISIAGQYKISEDIENEAWQIAVDISLLDDRLHIRAL